MKWNKTVLVSAILGAGLFAITSCEKLLPPAPEENELLDGPIAGLTNEQHAIFLRGDVAFNDNIFTPETGLGPVFVATSCGSCHAGDGRGHPFTTLTRFGQFDSTGNMYANVGGPQLQNRAIPGHTPETLPVGAPHANFTPPANTGLGYLEAVTDAYLIALQDPNDSNGDGISGVVNWVVMPSFLNPDPNAITLGGKYIGRFGRKAAAINLLNQTVNAYQQDMGITSDYQPQDLFHFNNGTFGTDGCADPEVPAADVNAVVFYLQTLKAPIRRNTNDPDVIAGEALFTAVNCSGCHLPAMQTGPSQISVLANQTFHPYTDLLLHDMGPGLDDGYTEGNALTSEWRTPPLWGLGLSPDSQGGSYFLMHDGRAHSIEDAILLHGGEAQNSRNAYVGLSQSEKDQLIKFLESL
jgi:CxxC motif-containing protein (DUF1111 family)